MRPIRTAIMGAFVIMATALVPGVAQASPAGPVTATPATTVAHLQNGQTVYVRSSTQSAASSAQPAANTYSSGSVTLCNNSSCSAWTVEIVFAVTYNGNNVWINGWPKCYQYGTQIAHCGYSGNGQQILTVSVDFGPGYGDSFSILVGGSGQCAYFKDLGVIVKPHCP